MAIRFRKSIKTISFLDPTQGFTEQSVSFEYRIDPLTRQRSRVADLKFRIVDAPDLQDVIDKSSRRSCPFCKDTVETMTPKFVPGFIAEGRIARGSALVFPNFMPYDQHNALTVFSTDHFIGLNDFSDQLLVDGFLASQEYFQKVFGTNKNSAYACINWNYMPPSGGSLIHPHLHLMADKEPSHQHGLLLRRGKRFWRKFNVNYWDALVTEEKKRVVRYIGETGTMKWLLYFAPKGMMFDIMGVFSTNQSILKVTTEEFKDFAQGLRNIFSFLEVSNLHSFNLAVYSGLTEKEYFRTHARIIPRFTIPPVETSDVSFTGMLHDEALAIMRPEDVCKELRNFF